VAPAGRLPLAAFPPRGTVFVFVFVSVSVSVFVAALPELVCRRETVLVRWGGPNQWPLIGAAERERRNLAPGGRSGAFLAPSSDCAFLSAFGRPTRHCPPKTVCGPLEVGKCQLEGGKFAHKFSSNSARMQHQCSPPLEQLHIGQRSLPLGPPARLLTPPPTRAGPTWSNKIN